MFEDQFFSSKNFGISLLLASLSLTLSQIIATTWCNANTDNFGYFIDDAQRWHSCVYEMPGDWLFRYGAALLTGWGAVSLLFEVSRTRATWLQTKTINISRLFFSLSLLSINLLLENLSQAWMRPSTNWPLYVFFDNFWYLFPTALGVFIVTAWSIANKVELIFTLNKRQR